MKDIRKVLSLVFLFLLPGSIFAQEGLSYGVKFVCGINNKFETQVVLGQYATTVNIHNPHYIPVTLLKKVVIAKPQRNQRGPISKKVREILFPDEAMGVDCWDIRSMFTPALGNNIIEGFLVVEVPDRLNQNAMPPLDVVGVYTARKRTGTDTSDPNKYDAQTIDIEQYEPKVIVMTDTPLLPDLTTRISGLQVDCPTGQGSCLHDVSFDITNLNTVDAVGPFSVRIYTDHGLVKVIPVGNVAGGATISLTETLGPGDNCYNPDCSVTVIVDDGDTVPETDETNNSDTALFVG